MTESIDKKLAETLRNFIQEIKVLSNESAKRHRFSALLGELFPGTKALIEYSSGVEKTIRIRSQNTIKDGRADNYFGNAIIEFENSLIKTLNEAEEQLREYVSGAWQKSGGVSSIIAIASDGLIWRVYRPRISEGEPIEKEKIQLDLLRVIELSEGTLSDFWLWITSILFREQQIEPSGERFTIDFGASSPLYRDGMISLKKAWQKVNSETETILAYETWQRYLAVTYGSLPSPIDPKLDPETGATISELEELFLRHTYLVCLSQFMIWAMLSQGKTKSTYAIEAKEILTGRYFNSKRLANLVDDDFFHWIRKPEAERVLLPTWEKILSNLSDYNLMNLKEDLLKGVYHELIDPETRHELGEYYTPDWLCEKIVHETLPNIGFSSVLDPSCGSGGFLRAAIAHYQKCNPHGTDNSRLREIISKVVGIDIHPVAVTISKATYVLALGKLIASARSPIHIPVYLADSLFLPREVEANLYQKISGVEITFGPKKHQQKIVLPEILIHHPELFDEAISACTKIAVNHAKTGKETQNSMVNYIGQVSPSICNLQERDQIFDALWDFVIGLSKLIQIKQDTIWSFVILNSYRPAMLKGKFDYIIGNPPWLSYRFVSDPEYQAEIKQRAVDLYRIAPTAQKLFTQMELATLFLAHSMATFANVTTKLAFVMPRSVLNGDQHRNLIERKYSPASRFQLTGYWDLKGVSPLFNVPTCVLMSKYSFTPGSAKDPLDVVEWSGKLPYRDVPWTIAANSLTSEEKIGTTIYMGQRAALATEGGKKAKGKPSPYQQKFRQGATIVPRNFYFINIVDHDGSFDCDTHYWAETDPVQSQQAKKPYKDIVFRGLIEGRFLFHTAISKHLMPFAVHDPALIALPIELKNGKPAILSSTELNCRGFREFGAWIEQAESFWRAKRGEKSEKQNIYQRLNYQNGITNQHLDQKHLVLYNHSGKNISASYYKRDSGELPFIVDVKLYWASCDTQEEAEYLVAILNSEIVNKAIKPFQSLGLLGERDIHKKVLELPIPIFDKGNKVHRELAALAHAAGEKASKIINSNGFPKNSSVARQRAYVRTQLADLLGKINLLVELLKL